MFAAVYIPDFAAQAVLRAEAALVRERPLAVLCGAPPLTRVVAMNEAARAAGVELGVTKLQAQALPHLALRMRSAAQEEAAHAALLDCAAGFSPRVEAFGPGTVVLDVAGLERLFGPEAVIVREVAQRASALGQEANVAAASNIEAAVHAARGFAGATVIPAGAEAERLAMLPLELLIESGLAPPELNKNKKQHTPQELLEIFDRWGVRTFRALALLPTIAVAERLGQRGVAMQKLARGEGLRQLTPAAAELRFAETLELEHPIENLESLAFALNRLLEQICARLEARALATNELRLRLELEDNHDRIAELRNCGTAELKSNASQSGSSAIRQFGSCLRFPMPMRDARLFLKLWQLELNTRPPQAPVTKIVLEAEPSRPQTAQHGLFMPLEPQPERLELMLARIASIVDSESSRAGAAELLDSNAPDAFRVTRYAGASAKARNGGSARSEPTHALALRRYRPARPARVESRLGAPARVECAAGPSGEVQWAAGPWRSSGEWWLANSHSTKTASSGAPPPQSSDEITSWAREEWDVRIGDGIYRLVRDAASGRWIVDGVYD